MDFDDIPFDILDLNGEDALDFLEDLLNERKLDLNNITQFEVGPCDMVDKPMRFTIDQDTVWHTVNMFFMMTLDYN